MPRARPRFSERAPQIEHVSRKAPIRNIADDVTRLGQAISAIENDVEEAPPVFSASTVHGAEYAMKYVIRYMIARDSQAGRLDGLVLDSSSEAFKLEEQLRVKKIKERRPEEFDSFSFWVTLIHTRQISGHGRISGGYVRTNHSSVNQNCPTSWQDRRVGAIRLEDDERSVVSGLPAPHASAKPLSLGSALNFLCWCASGARWYTRSGIPTDTYRKTVRLLRYLAGTMGWYPTACLEKTWLTDEQLDNVLTALWRPRRYVPCPQILVHQLLILCLTYLGFRQLSWLDNYYRQDGAMGVYARWGHIAIHFLGYGKKGSANEDEPEFIITGRVNPSKHFVKHGDAGSSPFQLGTRGDTELAHQDIALAFVMLAVRSEAYDTALLDVIESYETGQRLLMNGSRREYVFKCKSECVNAPIFVTQRAYANREQGFKHPLDKPTSALGTQYRPMNQLDFNTALRLGTEAFGFEGCIGSAIFRRTYSLKSQLAGRQGHSIASSMQHYGGAKGLHRAIYVPNNQPIDNVSDVNLNGAQRSETVQEAFATIGAARSLPRIEEIPVERLAELSTSLRAYLNVTSGISVDKDDNVDEEADPPTDADISAAADHLVATLARVTATGAAPVQLAARLSERLLRQAHVQLERGGRKYSYDDHPWIGLCGGKMLNILTFCSNDQIERICHSCLDGSHTPSNSDQATALQARVINECYMALHGQSRCFSCWLLFDVAKIKSHVKECVENRLKDILAESHDGLLKADDGFCMTKGPNRGPQAWEAATFFVCPFETCLDASLRDRHCTARNVYMLGSAMQVRPKKDSPMTGYDCVTVQMSAKSFTLHLVTHVFNQTKMECRPRYAAIDGQIHCGIFGCRNLFVENEEGFTKYVCHLVNDHHLPIVVDRESAVSKILTYVEPQDFAGHSPICRRHDPHHPEYWQRKGEIVPSDVLLDVDETVKKVARAYAYCGTNAMMVDKLAKAIRPRTIDGVRPKRTKANSTRASDQKDCTSYDVDGSLSSEEEAQDMEEEREGVAEEGDDDENDDENDDEHDGPIQSSSRILRRGKRMASRQLFLGQDDSDEDTLSDDAEEWLPPRKRKILPPSSDEDEDEGLSLGSKERRDAPLSDTTNTTST